MANHREFSIRLTQACDRSDDVPNYGKGRQTWIAERLGISQEAVRKYFNGTSRPRTQIMSRLAKMLNVDESWLALGVSNDIVDKDRRKYSEKADAAAYMLYGMFMASGFTCAFDEEDVAVDFHAIRAGKKTPVSVTVAIQKSKNVFTVPVRQTKPNTLNLSVVSPENGVFDILVMDNDGVVEHGEFSSDVTNVTMKHERQGYHTDGKLWVQLKDAGIL
jgi:transcriptional regulator with XRE-family HTH domain